jgi:hypothetical protein
VAALSGEAGSRFAEFGVFWYSYLMLTDQDIQKLSSVFANKQDLAALATKQDLSLFSAEIKEEIGSLRETVQGLSVAVDGLAKSVNDLRIEYAAVLSKIDRHERWIKLIAEKIGVHLEV